MKRSTKGVIEYPGCSYLDQSCGTCALHTSGKCKKQGEHGKATCPEWQLDPDEYEGLKRAEALGFSPSVIIKGQTEEEDLD